MLYWIILIHGATKMKQLAHVSLQIHLFKHFDLLTWFLLKFAENKWVVLFIKSLF